MARVRLLAAGVNECRRRGVSLLEIIVLLVVVAMVSAVAITVHFGRPEVTLEGAVKLLALDMQHAQANAAVFGRPARIEWLPSGAGYELVMPAEPGSEHPADEQRIVRQYGRDAVYRGVSASFVEPTGRTTIVIRPDGTAEPTGRVVFEFRGEVRVYDLDPSNGVLRPRAKDKGR